MTAFDTRKFNRRAYQLRTFAKGYATLGLTAEQAADWANAGYTPAHAQVWIVAGFTTPAEAAPYADRFIDPGRAAEMRAATQADAARRALDAANR